MLPRLFLVTLPGAILLLLMLTAGLMGVTPAGQGNSGLGAFGPPALSNTDLGALSSSKCCSKTIKLLRMKAKFLVNQDVNGF